MISSDLSTVALGAAPVSPVADVAVVRAPAGSGTAAPTPTSGRPVPPALSPAITRRLGGVVPANLQLNAPWQAIRAAREEAKRRGLDCSPSLMISWCVVRAMERHAAFRRLVQKDGSIVEFDTFDLGVAVALEGDRLGTAPIRGADRLAWEEFAEAYASGVAAVRAGRIEDVRAPVNVTSLGAFGVETGIPIVVPPAMGTLFIGKAHYQLADGGAGVQPAEVVTLSLTFDHKVVNGAGAAGFLHTVKTNIAEFRLEE